MGHSRRNLISISLAVALGAVPPSFVGAEDIDLFVGNSPSAVTQRPNVLVILDNSANWSAQSQHWTDAAAQGQSELRALKQVVGELDDTLNFGLMMFTPGSGTAKDGAYIRFAIRQMTAANKAALQELIGDATCVDQPNSLTGAPNCIFKNFDDPVEKVGTAKTDYSAAMFEAFKYFGGFTDPANAKTDVAGSPVVNTVPSNGFGPYRYAGNPDGKDDPAAFVTPFTTYRPPISADNNCAKNYIIFIGNGFPTQDSPASLLSGVLGDTTQLSMPQFTTTSEVQTSIIGQSCGSGNNNSQRLTNCTNNIPQSLKNANPGFDTYACIGTGVVDAPVCPGANNRKFNVQASKTVITVTATGTSAPPPTNEVRYTDEWAKYLFTTDVNGSPTDDVGGQLGAPGQQNVRTYTIDVFKDAQDARQTALLFNMAQAGGGKFFQATSEESVVQALRQILTEIQAENSVFAAASLPVSATNRADSENQVFFGLFRPDGDGLPRWFGNLKRYQVIKDNTGNTILADQNGQNAVGTSSFTPCASSFWTTDSGTYWSFAANAAGECKPLPTGSTSIFSDLPDGAQVEKGGAAEVLRKGNNPPATQTTPTFAVNRTMLTCADAANCGTLAGAAFPGMVAFNTTNVSQSAVGAADSTEHTKIVNYTRGHDANDENTNGDRTETRPSIHGDVVHSRPQPINYGGSTGVVIYYGANDGAFRAVRASDGKELWSFVAPEHHGKLKRLTNNSPAIAFPNVPASLTPAPVIKDYFFDGLIGLFQNADNSKIVIFPTMRRGGRSVYAFDVTNPNTPVLKWRAGCPNLNDNSGCTTGFEDIGQTWSRPSVAFIKGFSTTTPVIVMGGGYDACDDADNASPDCSGAKGKAVYVINADTGELIRSFTSSDGIERSVASSVALLERNFDGAVDHAYVVDTGGILYRIDFVNPATLAARAPADWTITRIAQVENTSGRKFLFPPAVLPLSNKVILTLGAGDRERPLITNYPVRTPVLNRFYAFVDIFSTDNADAINFDTSPTSVIADITTTPLTPPNCLPNIRGWRFDLLGVANPGVDTPQNGEQVIGASTIAGGKVFFNTNRATPTAPGQCDANLGEARAHNVDLFCGNKFSIPFESGGLPPDPVVATVVLPDGSKQTLCFGCATGGPGGPPLAVPTPPGQIKPVISPVRSRLYWYRHGDK